MENAYDFWDELTEDQRELFRDIKAKYECNHWWESDDPMTVLRHQIEERIQVVSFPKYMTMLGQFLQRNVDEIDLKNNFEQIRADVWLAIKQKEQEIGQSDAQREQAAHEDQARSMEEIIANDSDDEGVEFRPPKPYKHDKSSYDGWLK